MRSTSGARLALSAGIIAAAAAGLLMISAGCKRPEAKSTAVNLTSLSPAQRLRFSPAVAATNAFGFDLLRRLDADTAPGTGNVFVSPFSIMQAMTMVTNGAGGETQAEIHHALHLDGVELSAVNADQKKLRVLLSTTKKNSQNSLVIANSLWAGKHLQLEPNFVRSAHDFYNAPAKPLNFTDSKGAASTMNKWVSAATHGRITNLFKPEELKQPVRLDVVLANAVYFKAAWRTPFLESDTAPKPFTLGSGVQKLLPTMHQANMEGIRDGISYCKGEDFAMASLSYDNGNTSAYRSMLLILPDSPDGLNPLLARLTPENWTEWEKKLSPMVEMDLALPRFMLQYNTSLMPSLEQMGMRRAFKLGEADLAPMGLPSDTVISSVKHMTLLDVNEKGTEAVAVTGIVGSPSGGFAPDVEKVVFHVDRPFVCAIVDDTTGTILFLGVVRDPSAMN